MKYVFSTICTITTIIMMASSTMAALPDNFDDLLSGLDHSPLELGDNKNLVQRYSLPFDALSELVAGTNQEDGDYTSTHARGKLRELKNTSLGEKVACNGNCNNSTSRDISRQCINSFSKNGYDMYDWVYSNCRRMQSVHGLRAIQAYINSNYRISRELLSAAAAIRNRFAGRCLKLFPQNGYTTVTNEAAWACQNVDNRWSFKSIKELAENNWKISNNSIQILSDFYLESQYSCIQTMVDVWPNWRYRGSPTSSCI